MPHFNFTSDDFRDLHMSLVDQCISNTRELSILRAKLAMPDPPEYLTSWYKGQEHQLKWAVQNQESIIQRFFDPDFNAEQLQQFFADTYKQALTGGNDNDNEAA